MSKFWESELNEFFVFAFFFIFHLFSLSHSEKIFSLPWEVICNMGEQAGILASEVLFLDLPLSQETILNYWFKYWEEGLIPLSISWRKFYFGYIPQLFLNFTEKCHWHISCPFYEKNWNKQISFTFLVLKLRVNLPLKSYCILESEIKKSSKV